MEEEHARVAPALGAYAAGALEPGEAAEVEAHLAAATAGGGPGCRAGPGVRDLDPRRRRARRARPARPVPPTSMAS